MNSFNIYFRCRVSPLPFKMDWSLLCSAILPNEPLGFVLFFFLESYVFTGSVVPIASRLMIRSEFDNGVPNEILS